MTAPGSDWSTALADEPRRSWHWPWARSAAADVMAAVDDSQRTYALEALQILRRCEGLHQDWLAQEDEQRRHERLANAVAVYHWYLAGLRQRLAEVEPPASLLSWHDVVLASLDAACRATHLMSQGYRFHQVRRICEGGLLLEEARAQLATVGEALAKLTGLPLAADEAQSSAA